MKQLLILIVAIALIGGICLQNINAGYNIHQKKEAEKEYKQLDNMIVNIQDAIKDLNTVKKKKEVSPDNCWLATTSVTLDGTMYVISADNVLVKHIEVNISGKVTDLIRDELKVLLKKHLGVLKRKRDSINVE